MRSRSRKSGRAGRRSSRSSQGGIRRRTAGRSAVRRRRHPLRRKGAPPPANIRSLCAKARIGGLTAGLTARQESVHGYEDELQQLQQQWRSYCLTVAPLAKSAYLACMQAFIEGYFSATGTPAPSWVLLPTDRTVAAVVMAMNEEESIPRLLGQLERLPLQEIVIVVNGSTDTTAVKVRESGRAVLIHYAEALGHDVGRAVGARTTVSDIVLFVDADILVAAEQLLPFIEAVAGGMDIALNNLSSYMGSFSGRDEVMMLKEFVNRSVNRPDLTVNSLTAVPHALSRKAIQTIGAAELAVPPKAQVIALQHGLKVGTASMVDVITHNRLRPGNVGMGNQMARLIVGDHLEALGWMMKARNARMHYTDAVRNRRCASVGGE
ncbi:Glycosyl transferase family 2 [Paenibacillus algorifonticola]|uniref:Glycosyl transferase family 2 n=1 Tax=Paenibacillus algorifonticola TaxID=684063 RepID=A0A1I1Y6X6_9BACL|nr:glycosyltransferase [Paenibacillus algorifonticola]SFE15324.1 Glycosyl transferase family 2 [Paenibacillus algorifonticola]